ncbi:PIR Superfamily Protein [Plasmodium ovale wallikeri]|uniref:PIR Superfamily Protein n=1 Tax=Plasmodium ovale wallikeri TaxID=864142 RepID=A0A1A8ZSZ9_PLAOA|nr:PIR Superfamily Protein [Plasmodium ovale wallikeri]
MTNKSESKISDIPEFIFYNNLEETTQSRDIDIKEYMNTCNTCILPSPVESYIRRIIYNYNKLNSSLDESTYSINCRYLKYWVYREKKNYEIGNPTKLSDWRNCIPCIWKNLQTKNINSHGKCDLDYDDFSNAIISMKRELDMFCSIKNHLGNSKEVHTNKEECITFNKKKDHYLNMILIYLSSIPNITYLKPQFFHINDDCSLEKVRTIFSGITCPVEDEKNVITSQDCTSEIEAALSTAAQSYHCEPCPEKSATESLTCNSSYQFTPFGQWLHKRLRSRYILRKNIDNESTHELLESNSRY